MKYILLIFLLTQTAYAQIGIGHSVKAWGQVENITTVYYMDDNFYISASAPYYINTISTNIKPTITVGKKLLSYKNIDIFGTVSTMPFPVYNSSMYNFLVRIPIIKTSKMSIKYLHFSNGFSLFHDVNLGVDFLSISINI